MARVRDILSTELPPDLANIYERFASAYGPFRNQVAVIAHVPAALRHLMSMLMELAIIVVSKLNECDYCVIHHSPFLIPEGITAAGIDRVLDYQDHPELTEIDRLVVEYTIAAWSDPHKLRDALFERLRAHFSEAQIVELTLRLTLCGFFNKFNDALQIDEEPEALAVNDAVGAAT